MLYFLHFRFDPMTLCLYRDAVQVPLRPKVAQLLAYFLTHPNQVVARETLLSSLWQHGEFRETALTQSITELRQALSDSPQNPTFIKTIPQQGYLWICPVEQPHSKSLISHVTKLGKKATILLTAVGLTAIVSTVSYIFYLHQSRFQARLVSHCRHLLSHLWLMKRVYKQMRGGGMRWRPHYGNSCNLVIT